MSSEECYGYEDGKVYRFVSEYQRGLWLNLDPEDRRTLDATHYLVRRVKRWCLLSNGINVAEKEVRGE